MSGHVMTVLVEGGYFPGAAVGGPIRYFPRKHLGSTQLSQAQSGSDCAREVLWPAGPDYALKGMPVYMHIYIHTSTYTYIHIYIIGLLIISYLIIALLYRVLLE